MQGLLRRFTLYGFLNAAMGKEQLGIQLQHSLTGLAEAEMPRLDDACMNRPYRHFKKPLPLGGAHLELPLAPHLGIDLHRLPQGIKAIREALMQHQRPQIRMSLRHQAEHIMDFTLIPGRSRNSMGDALIAQGALRLKHSLDHLHVLLLRNLKIAINGVAGALGGFIPAEHGSQRMVPPVIDTHCRLQQGLRRNHLRNMCNTLHQYTPPRTICAA